MYGVKVDPEEFAAFAGMGEVGQSMREPHALRAMTGAHSMSHGGSIIINPIHSPLGAGPARHPSHLHIPLLLVHLQAELNMSALHVSGRGALKLHVCLMQAYFLSGVAGKYGLKIDDINALKEVFYGIYLEKAANPTESIGLPGKVPPAFCLSMWVMYQILRSMHCSVRSLLLC